jgi:tetratricopeptide (TPR) repeat protein
MRARLIVSLASLLVATPLLLGPAFSAGGAGSGDSDPVPTCKKGKVWDKKQKKCVAQQQGMLDDDSIYETGRALAFQGRYNEAITILTLAADKTDPRILNYLGYSHRKAGRVLVGLGYYEEALRNNPDYTLVREYMGEAHLQIGDVAAAKAQLDEIEKRCGTTCSEYVQLSSQIDAYGNKAGSI